MLSPNQIQELTDIINAYHIFFIAKEVGKDILSENDRNTLKSIGFKESDLPDKSKLEESFRFGMLAYAVGDDKVKKMSYNQFKKFLAEQQFLPLSEVEHYALRSIKVQAYGDIKGLGNRISRDLTTTIIEADKKQRSKYEAIIKQESERAISNRQTLKQLSSELSKKTLDYARDFDRISDYVMHQAFDEGRAMQILQKNGEEALVFKSVKPGACEHCNKLYLTNGFGSKPIVFKLQDLLGNGTNIGKTVKEYKPVIGATHPWSFLDKKTSVLTDKGWRAIKDINVGDFVLTHKGRFKKVVSVVKDYKVPKDYPIKKFFEIQVKLSDKTRDPLKRIIITAEHKVLTQRGWVRAIDLKKTDSLFKLKIPCSSDECINYLDFSGNGDNRVCSPDCNNDIRRKNANNLHNQNPKDYLLMKEKISLKVKENWKKGLHKNTLDEIMSEKHREQSRNRLNKNNTALNMTLKSSMVLTSNPQKRLFEKVKSIFPEAILEYKIFNRSLDIAIPEQKIDIEYDGHYWHNKRKEEDEKRDLLLKNNGWSVIRYSERIPSIKQIKQDIDLILNNHNDKYKFEKVSILNIIEHKLKTSHKLYDIGVEDDESFIARGIVVHNCRCTLFSVPAGFMWDKQKKDFSQPIPVERKTKGKIKIYKNGKEIE